MWSPVHCTENVLIGSVTSMQFCFGRIFLPHLLEAEKKTVENANFSHVLAPTNHPGMSCVRRISENLKGARLELRRNRWVKVSLNFWILGSQNWDSLIKQHRTPRGKPCLLGTVPVLAWGTSPGLWRGWAVPRGGVEVMPPRLNLGSLRESGCPASKTDNQSLPGDLGQLYSYL